MRSGGCGGGRRCEDPVCVGCSAGLRVEVCQGACYCSHQNHFSIIIFSHRLTQESPVSALSSYSGGKLLVMTERRNREENKPNCSYPNASISLWHVSAYCLISKPAFPGQSICAHSREETHLLHTTTETIIRQTRNNNIKCRAALPFSFLQQRQNPTSLKEIPRPAMHEQQRNRVLARGFLVQKVNVQFSKAVNFNFGHVLRQFVHLLFLLPLVIFRTPIFREAFDISSEGEGR